MPLSLTNHHHPPGWPGGASKLSAGAPPRMPEGFAWWVRLTPHTQAEVQSTTLGTCWSSKAQSSASPQGQGPPHARDTTYRGTDFLPGQTPAHAQVLRTIQT